MPANVHDHPSYLGFEIQTVSYFDLMPWGWRASIMIRKSGGTRYAVFPCHGWFDSESLAMTVGAAFAQATINGYRNSGRGLLSVLDT